MHAEVEELRPKLKELLYDCAVEIRATKAALYLYEPAGVFELITEYGFRSAARVTVARKDPIVERCDRARVPFFVNGVATEPRFSVILYESSSDRLLAAPILARGRLIGFIDMRDKAGKQPFDASDLPKAQRIAERVASLFASGNYFGFHFITLSNAEGTPVIPPTAATNAATIASAAPASAAARASVGIAPPPPDLVETATPIPSPPVIVAAPVVPPQPSAAQASPQLPPPSVEQHLPPLQTLLTDARKLASQIASAPSAELLTEAELPVIRDVLRSVIQLPGAVVAAFSAIEHLGGVQEMTVKSMLTEEASRFIQSKLSAWLAKRGEPAAVLHPKVHIPGGASGPPLSPDDMQKVLTATVAVRGMRGLYLTVAFSDTPLRATHDALTALLHQLQLTIEESLSRNALARMREAVAEQLVEPQFFRYPDLRRHTDLVVALTERFTRFLGMPPDEAAKTRIAATVHDAGMRLLDYDRLYTKQQLTNEELGILRHHVYVSAAMAAPLGNDIARAVLAHHERVDGVGYPLGLRGDAIPLATRVLQICDAWVAMTDPQTYQATESPKDALEILQRGAGTQFDRDLVTRFIEMLKSSGEETLK